MTDQEWRNPKLDVEPDGVYEDIMERWETGKNVGGSELAWLNMTRFERGLPPLVRDDGKRDEA